MTREEIIGGLKFTVEMFLFNSSTGEKYTEPRNDMDKTTIDACRGAIKILEQELCTDAINRQAALNCFTATKLKNFDFVLYAREEIKNLPSVTPQPKTGHWIMSDDGLYRPICDKCGAHPWKGYIPTVEEATEVFKYCPSCGSYNGGD